ncbi:hypothetical protein ACX40Y_08205 [Sphingomonas sp. RS6]
MRDLPEADDWHDPAFDPHEPKASSRLAPAIAILIAIAASAALLWLALPSLQAGLPPLQLVQLIAALCMPAALVVLLYLALQRSSAAEARRFGDTARAMRTEAASLDRTVRQLAERVVRIQASLAEQGASLTAIGDSAVERMDSAASVAARQAAAIAEAATTLGEATADAERRVSVVLASLPKAHDEMRGLAERVDAAGLLASQRAASLDTQLSALGERGREADNIAGGAAERLAAHIARMEATSEAASSRLEQVTDQMSGQVDAVLDRAAEAVDHSRKGIAAQGEAILAMLGANQAALERAAQDSAAAMSERMAMIEDAIVRISARLAEEQMRSDALFARLSRGANELDQDLEALHANGLERAQSLATSIGVLHQSVDAMAEAMRAGQGTAQSVIATSEALLTALDAAAREMDETMPDSLDRLDTRINASRRVVAASKPELLALVTAAESTHDAIEAIADVVAKQRDTLAKTQASLLETLATGGEQAEMLGQMIDEAIAAARSFTDSAAPNLAEALVRVRETSTAVADHARETLSEIVPVASRALEEASGAAIENAVGAAVEQQIASLSQAADAALAAAARASDHLSAQMEALTQASAALDAQIEDARQAKEAAESDPFSRRVSLLIEALHSASIDITKTFSTEITDSAWAAYLKGDRGVFTRRAVRLIEPHESREILRLYDQDDAFRDNVNRYIHDFEAMLRQILALRDGSTLAVTLLSSDMGKLYVALAQAIERLRT